MDSDCGVGTDCYFTKSFQTMLIQDRDLVFPRFVLRGDIRDSVRVRVEGHLVLGNATLLILEAAKVLHQPAREVGEQRLVARKPRLVRRKYSTKCDGTIT